MAIVVSAIILLSAFEVARSGGETCGEVRRTFRTRALGPADMVPIMPAEVTGLSVCQSVGPTCCTPPMEEKYMEASVRELKELVKRKTTPLEKHFRAIAKKFRGYWNQMVKRARSQEINEGTNTSHLERFYNPLLIPSKARLSSFNATKNLNGILSSLFILSLEDEIGLKIPKEKIECALTKATSYLTPYAILKSKFENLLNPVGVFLKALTVGLRAAEASRRIATGGPCIDAITKMRYCSHCYGYTLIKTCPGLCHNVVRGCLVGMAELDMFWKYYIVSINNMANKLVNTEGGFDVYFPQILRNISSIVQSVPYNQESVTLILQQCKIHPERVARSLDRLPIADADELNELRTALASRKRRRRHRHRTDRKPRAEPRRGRQSRDRKNRNIDLHLKSRSLLELSRDRVRPPFEMLLEDSSLPNIPLPTRERVIRKKKNPTVDEMKIPTNLKFGLSNHITRFADELNTTRDFFASFSDDLCSSSDPVSFQVSNYGHCWDGVKMANSYKKPTPDKGIEGQLQNPEVKVVTLKRDVQTIIEDVRTITKELMKSSGSKEIPSDLLQRPSYITSHLQTDEIPCDDEDECFDNGSGEQSGEDPDAVYPDKPSLSPEKIPFPIAKTNTTIKRADQVTSTTSFPLVFNNEATLSAINVGIAKEQPKSNVSHATSRQSGGGHGNASQHKSRTFYDLLLFAIFSILIAQGA
ncbi:glypican-5 isoform X1 [Ciona intestinalis]